MGFTVSALCVSHLCRDRLDLTNGPVENGELDPALSSLLPQQLTMLTFKKPRSPRPKSSRTAQTEMGYKAHK
eukprot:2800663-Amphidinium_carterae.1